MVKNETQWDAVIVGGGVIGLSTAWELSQRGARVCLVEAQRIGRSASWAGAGILPPVPCRNAVDPYEQLRALSHRLHQQWAARLLAETGIDNGYRRCGGIYLARSLGESATLLANESWWADHAIDFRQLPIEELLQLEPSLAEVASQLRGVWLLPDECQLRNPWHLQALQEACRRTGVQLRDYAEVTKFDFADGGLNEKKVAALRTADGSRLSAASFCICAGAWARQFLTRLGHPNGIMPVRGQMVLYDCSTQNAGSGTSVSSAPSGAPVSRVINEGNRYLVPRSDGLLLAGSVEEEVGYVCERNPEAIRQIREWAEEILPVLKQCEIRDTWAGLRPGSFDGLPYIGQVPGVSNLYLAAGHFRSGLHLSCATAQVTADLMTGKTVDIDLTPFRVGRG